MSRRSCLTPVVLFALGLMVGGPAAFAQKQDQPAGGAAQAAVPDMGAPDTGKPDSASEASESFPVLAIASVEIMRGQHAPVTDIVVAHGLTSADGWTDGELVPLTHGTPSDGVLDLVLVAKAPQETVPPNGYAPIQSILPLTEGHPYKAVRVRSATNSVIVKSFPGYVEARLPVEACNPCVGKYFVAKGAGAPAGVAAADIVREESLPPNARIVRPTDGIADIRPDPNRLTILVGEDGRIVDAEWE